MVVAPNTTPLIISLRVVLLLAITNLLLYVLGPNQTGAFYWISTMSRKVIVFNNVSKCVRDSEENNFHTVRENRLKNEK